TTNPTNMNTAVFVALLALATAAPRPDDLDIVQLLRNDRAQEGASYNTQVELDNGIIISEVGDDAGVQGTYVYTAPDGQTVELRLVAGEGGAVFESPSGHLPVAPLPVLAIHPVPEHALEQIEAAAQARAAGVEWDQQGFVIE
ncbi:unnamed protein product, partial [Meganyctiphanes norvegica]